MKYLTCSGRIFCFRGDKMLGRKVSRFIIAFSTTYDAIAAERLFKDCGLPGRLVPVPREISAGCGMAWAGDPDHGQDYMERLEEKGICPEHHVVMEI